MMEQKVLKEIKVRGSATPNEMTPLQAAKILTSSINIQGPVKIVTDELLARATACNYLRRVASGELQPVIHAHWKEVEPGHDVLYECSNCGRTISTSWGCCEDEDTKGCNGCDPTEEWLCCPTCRALMDGKDDSHDPA